MEENKRIGVLSVIVEDKTAVESINALLTEFSAYVVGRMGIPYAPKAVSIISVVLDIPAEKANALTGKIGKLQGVSAKMLFGKI